MFTRLTRVYFILIQGGDSDNEYSGNNSDFGKILKIIRRKPFILALGKNIDR